MSQSGWRYQDYVIEAKGRGGWLSTNKWIEVYDSDKHLVLHSASMGCRRGRYARFLEQGLTLYEGSHNPRPTIKVVYPSQLIDHTVALCDVIDWDRNHRIGSLANEVADLHKVHKLGVLQGLALLQTDWSILDKEGNALCRMEHLGERTIEPTIHYRVHEGNGLQARIRMRFFRRFTHRTDLRFEKNCTSTTDPRLLVGFVAFRLSLSLIAPVGFA